MSHAIIRRDHCQDGVLYSRRRTELTGRECVQLPRIYFATKCNRHQERNRILQIQHSFFQSIDKSSRWSPSKALEYFIVFGHVISFATVALVVVVLGDGCPVEEFVHARNRDDLCPWLVLDGCCSCVRLARDGQR